MPIETDDRFSQCTLNSLTPFGLLIEDAAENSPLANLPIEQLRELVLKHRLLVLRGFAPITEKQQFTEYCQNWGELLEWDFGYVFEVLEHDDPKNYLFTSGSVPYHWDGAFAKQTPWLQFFQCHESPGAEQGGETLFCDTARIWRKASADVQNQWKSAEIEYSTEKVAHYGGAIRVPLLGRHPHTGETTLHFAEPANADTAQLNTPEFKVHGLPEAEVAGFLQDLIRRIYESEYVYAHSWQNGDYVIADNHALLHGRTPYRKGRPRRLWRVHIL